ncbi:MAG: two-component sensor histidine kinase, partial [Oscillospiraceae bacterium]|nr:two-component sensor histidine kinase [Oscillospiraceae bacterium]
MKRLSGSGSITHSVQFKFAATFLVLIAALLVMLNTYPTIVSRDLAFSTKQASLQAQAGVISS